MKIKYVDGAKIRNTFDTDFSGAGDSSYYPYIPKNEYWIERYLRPETKLLLSLDRLEKKMKNEPFSAIRKQAMRDLTTRGTFRSLQTMSQKGLVVRYVVGADVRKTLDPYFLLGGHSHIYRYIPKNEIWIDACADDAEQVFTLVHEMYERDLMRNGMSYDDAHDFALAAERAARRKAGVAHFIRG